MFQPSQPSPYLPSTYLHPTSLSNLAYPILKKQKTFYFHDLCAVLSTQWAFGAKMMSYERRSDVITAHRR